jgi:ParB family chromosome partitioning protein
MVKKNKSLNLQQYTGVVQGATQRTPDARIKVNLIDVEAQVRTQFDEQAQAELDASVKAQGVIQPVVLLAKPDGRYRLIAGERRLRSTLNNGIDDIPAVIRSNLEPWEIRRIQVSENAERDDITPHDEARAVSEDVANYGFQKRWKSGTVRRAGSANVPRSPTMRSH